MIRRSINWLRIVLPPPWVLVVVIGLYLMFEMFTYWLVWWSALPEAADLVLPGRNGLFAGLCAAYGMFRVLRFHPVFCDDYRQWLKQTPWTSKRALPVGPVRLVPQDVVVLAIVLVLLHDWPLRFLTVPLAFLSGYLAMLCYSFWITGQRRSGYLLAFGVGLVVRVAVVPGIALGIAVMLYPLALVALRRALARFPWEDDSWWNQLVAEWENRRRQLKMKKSFGKPVRPDLGWPFDRFQPAPRTRGVRHADGLLVSLLAGWWMYALASIIPDGKDKADVLTMLCFYATIACLVTRLFTYCRFYWPPISLWGRIRTFRWIVPGYDQVFVAPIGILLTGIIAPLGLRSIGLAPDIAIPISLSLVLVVTLNVGPTLRGWQLTGSHRVVPGIGKSQEFQQL